MAGFAAVPRQVWEAGVRAVMTALMTAMLAWLAANFDLPVIHHHPDVVFVPTEHITEIRYGGQSAHRREVLAVYDDKSRTIYLSDTWTGETPADLSILVHELVHHLQRVAGLRDECPAAREKLAYDAQAQWLALSGHSIYEEFEIDPLTLKLTTTCMSH